MTTQLTVSGLNKHIADLLADAEKMVQGEEVNRTYPQMRGALNSSSVLAARQYIKSKAFDPSKENHLALKKGVEKVDEVLKQLSEQYSTDPNWVFRGTTVFFGSAWYFGLSGLSLLGTGAAILGALYALKILDEREDKKQK